jgi:hypothetical protein
MERLVLADVSSATSKRQRFWSSMSRCVSAFQHEASARKPKAPITLA